jgi:hypothetical protein
MSVARPAGAMAAVRYVPITFVSFEKSESLELCDTIQILAITKFSEKAATSLIRDAGISPRPLKLMLEPTIWRKCW